MAVNLAQNRNNSLPMVLEWRAKGMTFAVLVRHYRKVQGWTQAELAEEWSYSFETISSWERGKRWPSRTEISRLACLLGMDATELAEMIVASRSGQECAVEWGRKPALQEVSKVAVPFEQGRLFWTLHLGIEHGRLQCLITCPLASGETWEVSLDSVAEGEIIRQLHRVVHEQVSKAASGSVEQLGG